MSDRSERNAGARRTSDDDAARFVSGAGVSASWVLDCYLRAGAPLAGARRITISWRRRALPHCMLLTALLDLLDRAGVEDGARTNAFLDASRVRRQDASFAAVATPFKAANRQSGAITMLRDDRSWIPETLVLGDDMALSEDTPLSNLRIAGAFDRASWPGPAARQVDPGRVPDGPT